MGELKRPSLKTKGVKKVFGLIVFISLVIFLWRLVAKLNKAMNDIEGEARHHLRYNQERAERIEKLIRQESSRLAAERYHLMTTSTKNERS
jgi:hypothetical protein